MVIIKKISGERKNLIPIYSPAEAEHSPAAEVIFSDVDLLTEVLLRLPAKSLIRFKCVSNHWLSLISDSQFIRKHTRRNPSSSISGLYFYINPWYVKGQVKSVSLHGDSTLPTLSFLDGVGAASTTKVLHSCNGLLLCTKIGFDVCCNPYHSCYIVCNPAIQKHRLLTLPEPCRSLFHGNVGAVLAFDPSKSPLYKAVFVSYSNNFIGHFYQIDVYSSEDASWKHTRVAAPGGIPFTKSVFCNGAIHWMSRENVRIQFDVDAEKLTGITFPPNPKISFEDNDILYFGECGGHLLLMQSLRCRGPMAFRIVEMETDSCHWVGKYRGNLRTLIPVFPEIFLANFNVLYIVKGANEKDFTLILVIPGRVISYNLKFKTWNVLGNLPLHHFHDIEEFSCRAFHFIESLSPV